MWPSWIIRIGCAALGIVLPGGAAAFAQPVAPGSPGDTDVGASHPVSIRWSDICRLSVDRGRLGLQSDLTLEQMRSVVPDMAVNGIAGKTSILMSRRSFLVRNRQETPAETMELTISASSSALSIEMQLAMPDETRGVVLYQLGSGLSQRADRGVRLTLSGQETLTYEAATLAELRERFPHQVNRHLRPALLAAKADLLQIDSAVARQVLLGSDATDPVVEEEPAATQPGTTQPTPTQPAAVQPAGMAENHGLPVDGWPVSTPADPALAPKVLTLLKQLDNSSFRERAASASRLAQIGPPAAVIIARMDRGALSAEQNLALDLFMAAVHPLDAASARRARRDPHFLLDCLYATDPSIRSAAAERLAHVLKRPAERFQAVAMMDPVRNQLAVATAIEDLRDGLAPPK